MPGTIQKEECKDCVSLCSYLEEHAFDCEYEHQIGQVFSGFLDKNREILHNDEIEHIQWEIHAFSFTPEAINREPELQFCSDRPYDYFANRFDQVRNPLLRQRYGCLLWHSPRKHARFACGVVEASLELCRIFETKDSERPNEFYGLRCLDAVREAFRFAAWIKYRLDEVKGEILRLLYNYSNMSSSYFALKINLIELMADSKRGFTIEEKRWAEEKCWDLTNEADKSDRVFALQFAEVGERLAAKVGNSPRRWADRIGELYAFAGKGTDPLISTRWIMQSISAYKRAGNKGKVREMSMEYEKAVKSIKLNEIKFEIDGTELHQSIDKIVKQIVSLPNEQILKHLSVSPRIIPNLGVLRKNVQESKSKTVFHHLVSFTRLDSKGNVAGQRHTPEQKDEQFLAEQYQVHLSMWGDELLTKLLVASTEDSRITLEWLLNTLKESSWLGHQFARRFPDGQIAHFSWLDLLRPALVLYYASVLHAKPSDERTAAVILCTDSLAPKLEGMLRDMCDLLGEPTTIHSTREEQMVASEKTLDHLLDEKALTDLLGVNNVYFLRFLLSNKDGFNLRHRVSHSLMCPQEYVEIYVHWLILAVLRLSAFMVEKGESESSICRRFKHSE